MLYKDGDIIWTAPIRYFDTPMPQVPKFRVVKDQLVDTGMAGNPNHLYVFSEEYGHNVYISEVVFYKQEHAQAYAEHLRAIHNLVREDEACVITTRILESMNRLGDKVNLRGLIARHILEGVEDGDDGPGDAD